MEISSIFMDFVELRKYLNIICIDSNSFVRQGSCGYIPRDRGGVQGGPVIPTAPVIEEPKKVLGPNTAI